MVCDFCSGGSPVWFYLAEDFAIPGGAMSAGGWTACESCHACIERGDRETLHRQVIERFRRRHGRQAAELAGPLLRETHERFFAHRTGSARRSAESDIEKPTGSSAESIRTQLALAEAQVLGAVEQLKFRVDNSAVPRPAQYMSSLARGIPDVWKKLESARAHRQGSAINWPGCCYVPRPVASAIPLALSGRERANSFDLMSGVWIAALGAWRMTQGIYRFDETLAGELRKTPLNREIPAEIFCRLPEWCVYIETPGRVVDGKPAPGFFVYVDAGHAGPAYPEYLDLVMLSDVGDPDEPDGAELREHPPVPLGKGSIEASLDAAFRWGVERQSLHMTEVLNQPELRASAEEYVRNKVMPMIANELELIRPLVPLVLYLCTENAEVLDRIGKRSRPGNPEAKKVKGGMRVFPAERLTRWDVGFRLGAALRRGTGAARNSQGGTHASPRPHIRTAHWHSFWTGPRATMDGPQPTGRKLVVHWLPPTPVNVDDVDDLVPTVRPVK
jgi:hypothetical protein